MRTYVLDASALLRFTDKEPGFEKMRTLFQRAAMDECRLCMSAVNWGEVVTAISRHSGPQASSILDNLAALPMSVVPVDAGDAAEAGQFKLRYGVPYADAFAGAQTLKAASGAEGGAILVTADNDFRKIPREVMQIEFLPGK